MQESPIVITAFYHFVNLPHFENLKQPMLDFCNSIELKGTILIAREGINSTISGSRESIDKLYTYLRDVVGIKNLEYKETFSSFKPFFRMKVRLKKEIVAMGVEDIDMDNRGQYIEPEDWDEFINSEDVITIDTRNEYEIMLGTFKNAINPHTSTFRETPDWMKEKLEEHRNKKIAMYCTGGVRCEKSTAYLKNLGFPEVYHLRGGILQYFESTKNKNSMWEGNCFVFDDRVAVNDKLEIADDILCSDCGKAMNTDDVRDAALIKKLVCLDCS